MIDLINLFDVAARRRDRGFFRYGNSNVSGAKIVTGTRRAISASAPW
jgi:hypothetical protein